VFESLALRKDGSVFPVELSVRLMEVEGARYRQTIVRDITEHRKAEAQTGRLNRLYAVLSRCGQAIVRAPGESALFQEVVDAAVESGGFRIATIGEIDPATGQIVTVARAGESAAWLDEISKVAGDGVVPTLAPGLAERSLESGALVCNDLWRYEEENLPVLADTARKYGVRSLLSLVLWRGGRLAGELRLYSAEPDFFSEEETKLATVVAENLSFALESIERKRRQENVEAELRSNRERLELVLDATGEAYWDWDLKTDELHQSPRYDSMLGYGPYEVPRGYDEWLSLTHPEDAGRVNREFNDFVSSGKDLYSNEFRMRGKSGEYIWISARAKVVRRDSDGLPARLAGTLTDITDRKKLEEQLGQAQKLESVGRLAGGVAHDFNNLLTVINGYTSLLIKGIPKGDVRLKQLGEIRKAGERAAELTRQLLTFSLKNITEPRLLNLNSTVADCEMTLRRLAPDNIEFSTFLEARQDAVVIDPSQVQQVLMNLVVNACDAMPSGGRLTVRTANVDVARGDAAEDAQLTVGVWVLLEVADTGSGMDEETLRRIFEPFFTTKDVGKGTGLGLSTVYGIVQQCRGIVRVESSPGAGTTFRVYFPVAAEGILAHGITQTKKAAVLTGSETVLVVEDQDDVRDYAVNALRTYGYSVIAARSGPDALDLAKRRMGPIDLLLTDVVMPSTDGRAVALELRKIRPETRVIYMSGHVDGAAGGAVEMEPKGEYLQKPFSPEALAARVRRALSGSTVPRTILVVEDEPAVRDLFLEFLGEKHRLLLACDGKEALDILRSGRTPDLVITDLVMPNREGIELIREIRRIRPAARIIAMSGAFSGRFLKTAELLGADATLVKPIRPEVLDQVIEDVLGQDR
jgi:PAS domain S-box-containing protein